jgi:hypothetical protein
LLAPIHVTGVGGAYVASAEDTEGSTVNAASPVVRDPYSIHWFDYDLSIGVSSPGAGAATDFDDHGDGVQNSRAGDFVDLNFGGTLQFGEIGAAATGDLQQFSLNTSAGGTPGLTMQIGRWKALGAVGFFDGQLAVGGGVRILTMQIQQNQGPTLLTMTGLAPEVGALYMPTGLQWRLGAAARAPVNGAIFGGDHVTTDPTSKVERTGAFVLPNLVTMPWEVELGVAYQLGPRPLNPGWHNPHEQESWLRDRIDEDRAQRARRRAEELALLDKAARATRSIELDQQEAGLRAVEDERLAAEVNRLTGVEKARYANWPRERILLLASVLLTGPSANAVSVEDFLEQHTEKVGTKLTATPRLGMEGEPLRDRMVLRIGTYVEPSRYEGADPRQHFTFGGDVRLFPLDFWGLLPETNWKIGFVVDVAPRYQNIGIGIGNWH